MNSSHDAVLLRRYACICAREAARIAQTDVAGIVLASERFAAGMISEAEFKQARDLAQPASAGAGVVGLPHCFPAAAACLSAIHTSDESAETAAFWSAEFAGKAAVFKEAQIRSVGWYWPEDAGEPWRAPWRSAEWLKRHPYALKPVENAVRATLRDLRRSLESRAGGGRILAFRSNLDSPVDAW